MRATLPRINFRIRLMAPFLESPQISRQRSAQPTYSRALQTPLAKNLPRPKVHFEWRLANPRSETLPSLTAKLMREKMVLSPPLRCDSGQALPRSRSHSPLARPCRFAIPRNSYTAHRARSYVTPWNSLLSSRIPPLLAFRLPSTARGTAVSLTPYACTSSNSSTENQHVLNPPHSFQKANQIQNMRFQVYRSFSARGVGFLECSILAKSAPFPTDI